MLFYLQKSKLKLERLPMTKSLDQLVCIPTYLVHLNIYFKFELHLTQSIYNNRENDGRNCIRYL